MPSGLMEAKEGKEKEGSEEKGGRNRRKGRREEEQSRNIQPECSVSARRRELSTSPTLGGPWCPHQPRKQVNGR